MRYKIKSRDRENLFATLRKTCGTWRKSSGMLMVSEKTLIKWRSGTTSVPEKAFLAILAITKLPLSFPVKKIEDYWYTSRAGKIGASVSQKLYGNPGTFSGRRKGGLRAIKTHKKNPDSRFQSEKQIRSPRQSKELAEVLGMFFGDGHLGKYQASITLNSETDREYGRFIADLIEKKFLIAPSIRKKRSVKAIEVVISSISLVHFLIGKGMPQGNKIRSGLSIPQWIKSKKEYTESFLRGLFDTDGCVYLDKHTIKEKTYLHMGWTITSHSDTLIVDIQEALKRLGFNPTHSKNQHSVFLRRHEEIVRYFKNIQTSNIKHQKRFQRFIQEK